MKTLEQIAKYKGDAIDGRDMSRLVKFVPEPMLKEMGIELKPEFVGKHIAEPLTRENVLAELKTDLSFAFEKALNKRGISASCMYNVIRMWNWVLEEGLEDFDEYAQYGLPLLKATANKYGFTDEIAGYRGDEYMFSSGAE